PGTSLVMRSRDAEPGGEISWPLAPVQTGQGPAGLADRGSGPAGESRRGGGGPRCVRPCEPRDGPQRQRGGGEQQGGTHGPNSRGRNRGATKGSSAPARRCPGPRP